MYCREESAMGEEFVMEDLAWGEGFVAVDPLGWRLQRMVPSAASIATSSPSLVVTYSASRVLSEKLRLCRRIGEESTTPGRSVCQSRCRLFTVDGVIGLFSGFTSLRAGSKPNLDQSPLSSCLASRGWVVEVIVSPCSAFVLADLLAAQ